MGLTPNVVAGAPILSATWGNTIRDRTVQVFATEAERTSQWPTPPTGAMSWLQSTSVLSVYNGGWVCVTPQGAKVDTSEPTSSGAYVNLATVGPAVTIQTGTKALVHMSAQLAHNTAGQLSVMSFDITGATTRAAQDTTTLQFRSPNAGDGIALGASFYVTGLTAGANTFTAKHRMALTGAASFAARNLTVVGVP